MFIISTWELTSRYPKVMPTLFKLTIQVLSELALQRKMAPADDNKLSKNN
jgi:hypothetical protein